MSADRAHIGRADRGKNEPRPGDLEESERGETCLLGHAIDQDVGGGADERGGAAEDGRKRQWDKHLRGGKVHGAREADGDRDEHHDNRRVVDECRKQHDNAHHQDHGLNRTTISCQRDNLSADTVDDTGSFQRG